MIHSLAAFRWAKQNFQPPVPDFVKKRTILAYHLPNCVWVETGTYRGKTTEFLAKIAVRVFTIEASKELYRKNCQKLAKHKNIVAVLGSSQQELKTILLHENGDICFWLDAHYCGPETFASDERCPILEELKIIFELFPKFRKVHILIDDIRDFVTGRPDYPDKLVIIQEAVRHGCRWELINDILILLKTH